MPGMRKASRFLVRLISSSYATWGFVWNVVLVGGNAAASGGGVMAAAYHFTHWPIWQQILVSIGVAFVWLTVTNWIVGLFNKSRTSDESTAGQHLSESPKAQQASGAGRDIYQAGGDLIVTQQAAPAPKLGWNVRPGGPTFRMSPGISAGQLLCEFLIQGTPLPGGVKARWVGAGTSEIWKTPMAENKPGKYQMKGESMSPEPSFDEVTFEVKFFLEDGEHGGRWHWPLEQHPKGHWSIEAQKGSHIFQPRPEDTW